LESGTREGGRKMGTIRDEIEKLYIHPHDPYLRSPVKCLGDAHNRVVDDVLSILDEWKLVGNVEWKSVYDQDQYAETEDFDWLLLEVSAPVDALEAFHKLKPGDTIIIYKRRGKEDE